MNGKSPGTVTFDWGNARYEPHGLANQLARRRVVREN